MIGTNAQSSAASEASTRVSTPSIPDGELAGDDGTTRELERTESDPDGKTDTTLLLDRKDLLTDKSKLSIFDQLLLPSPEEALSSFYKRFSELRELPLPKKLYKFSCSYDGETTPLRGKLFITDQHACYHASHLPNILIPLSDITSIDCPDTPHPSSLRIVQRGDTERVFFKFSSKDRDVAYTTLINNTAALGTPYFRKSHSSSLIKLVEPTDIGSAESGRPATYPRSGLATPMPSSSSSSRELADFASLTPATAATSTASTSTLSLRPCACDCSCASHHSTVLIDQTFAAAPETLFLSIFGESDTLYQPWLSAIRHIGSEVTIVATWSRDGVRVGEAFGALDIDRYGVGEWKSRTLEYYVKAAMVSRSVCYEKQTLSKLQDGVFVVDTSVQTPKVPFGDTFTIENRYCITRVGDGRSRLLLTMHVNLIKSVWISGQITRNVLDGQKNYSKKLVEELERSFTRSTSANKGDQNVASAPPSQQAPPPSSTLSVAQFNIVTQLFPLGRTVTLSAILCILIAVLLMASRAPWVMVASPRIEMSPLCDGNCQLARTLADLSGNALYVRRLEDELRETRATICRMEARLRALERSHV